MMLHRLYTIFNVFNHKRTIVTSDYVQKFLNEKIRNGNANFHYQQTKELFEIFKKL